MLSMTRSGEVKNLLALLQIHLDKVSWKLGPAGSHMQDLDGVRWDVNMVLKGMVNELIDLEDERLDYMKGKGRGFGTGTSKASYESNDKGSADNGECKGYGTGSDDNGEGKGYGKTFAEMFVHDIEMMDKGKGVFERVPRTTAKGKCKGSRHSQPSEWERADPHWNQYQPNWRPLQPPQIQPRRHSRPLQSSRHRHSDPSSSSSSKGSSGSKGSNYGH